MRRTLARVEIQQKRPHDFPRFFRAKEQYLDIAHQSELCMDISFKCPICDQELEVDASGAGSNIECPSCSNSITVPQPDPAAVVHAAAVAPAPAPPEPPKEEKHFSVPVHQHAPPQELIKKPNRP